MKPKTTLLHLSILTVLILAGCSDKKVQDHTSTKKSTAEKSTKTKSRKYFTECKSKMAFMRKAKGLSNDEIDQFVLGKSFFRIPWVEAPSATTARDGLGPLFNANTCMHCHPGNGAGIAVNKDGSMSRSLLLRLSHKNPKDTASLKKAGFEPDSTYGAQLSKHGNHYVIAEGTSVVAYEKIEGSYPDGSKYSLRKPSYSVINKGYGEFDEDTILAPRIGSALIGLGQLELISEKDILAFQDIDDKNGDGISGKANYAFDPETNSTKLGRFTWKASATTVKHQSAGAAHNDMGLTNPLFPMHNCTKKQKACMEESQKGKFEFELPAKRLNAIAFYLSNLAIPKQRKAEEHLEGAEIFKTINCTACHVESYTTASSIEIKPYSDLLLHDMGEELADGRSEFLASGSEWRTAPMWGIGLYEKVSGEANYLHDGRARSLEEAILWHGGEAEESKKEFMALDKNSREKVLYFLNSI